MWHLRRRICTNIVTSWNFSDNPPQDGKVKGECPGECWAYLVWDATEENSDPTYVPGRGYHFDGDDHMTLTPGDYMFPKSYTVEIWIMLDQTNSKPQYIFNKNGGKGEHNW